MESPARRRQNSSLRLHRKALQPKNSYSDATAASHEKPKSIQTPPLRLTWGGSDKENYAFPYTVEEEQEGDLELVEATLEEELLAVRQKNERLRADRERTEEVLRERDVVLERGLKEMEKRWREQRRLETELDRLFRLKGLRCTNSPRFRSLREKEEKKTRESHLQGLTFVEEEKFNG